MLEPLPRLALAYAPGPARATWLAFLALDARLGRVVRDAREPMIGQIRLAWWRDRLAEPANDWPKGEPLLQLLRQWGGDHGGLLPVVDGWEVLLGKPPLSGERFLEAASGRAAGAAAVATRLGAGAHLDEVARLGRNWALADFAARVSDPREATTLAELVGAQDWRPANLPRALRPLVVLHGLAGGNRSGTGQFLTALRLGFLGR